ncbi:type VI secretion system protein [Humidesulfovibrio mexicanus]|uniref:Type VI secretion system protein n=1 Tax=Humidesulfovibrio mexicanus TaxID=147047 RepID=A0A239A4B9_9BACT|nr:type VI secretion system baseplate subunit TssE [Humidesulfovibrio mexicanus]SNR89753.1 type VI secretion system protein [Humidesulfovibrio mexicanus]
MREKRLLERLRAVELNPDWRGGADPAAGVRSVLEHIAKMLNTRQGSAPIAQDYGVPDFTSIASTFGAESVGQVEEAITAVILRYEPRLSGVKVSFEPQADRPFSLAFRLSARLTGEGRQTPVVFETILNPDGRITVME